MQNKAKQNREALAALKALGYWDFVTIQSALDMAIDYLSTHEVECAVATPESCKALKAKMEKLLEKARQL